jgi:hypothetical protein
MNIVVIGGGFIGQLIQLVCPDARLLDWRKTAPTHHLDTRMGPQYLWEPIEYPNVKSSSFKVRTTIDDNLPTDESILAYKKKIGKEFDGGDWGLQFQPEMVGWASALPVPRVEYGQQVTMVDLPGHTLGMKDFTTITYDVLVNTIPMSSFLEAMLVGPQYNESFKSDAIYMGKRERLPVGADDDTMILNYISVPDDPHYRETTVGTTKYYETLQDPPPTVGRYTRLAPGKIHHHPENETIIRALAACQCYCFGRFATWRPDELAHESWKQILQWKEGL